MPQRNTISHFTHPNHPLTKFDADTQYLCNGCRIHGSRKRYRCNQCDFNLHDYCGTCPLTLPSSMHPHQLRLLMSKEQGDCPNDRVCSACSDSVEGLFYRCGDCEFNIHVKCVPENKGAKPRRSLKNMVATAAIGVFCLLVGDPFGFFEK